MLIAINRLYDQILRLIENGAAAGGITLLIGHLAGANLKRAVMDVSRETLRNYDLHRLLLEDSHTYRDFTRPRRDAGDAELIDYYYDRCVPPGTSLRGAEMFAVSTGFQTAQAVCARCASATDLLEQAWVSGKRVCSLAFGHLREAGALIGRDLGNVGNAVADFVIGTSLPSCPVVRPRS